jgi:hypothetical protein
MSDEADYSLHDLNVRCERLEIEYDDYMTYYYKTELDSELPSFEPLFIKVYYNSKLIFPGYQSKEDFLQDFRAEIWDR